jgi:hypothetical protein
MKRIMMLVAVVALMAAMMVASALPAVAEGQGPPEQACIKIAVKSIIIGMKLPAVDNACGDTL